MTLTTGITPVDLANLMKGPTPFIYGLASEVTVPANLADIFDPDDPDHPLETGWSHGGATLGGSQYGRQFQTSALGGIEQITGNVDEDVQDTARSFTVPIGEISAELLQVLEQAPAITTVAQAKGRSAEKQIKAGSIETLENYRVVFVGRRLVGKGADVKMSGGETRGAFVAACLLMAKITGDQAAIGVGRGQLSSASLTFQAYPDPTQPKGEEQIIWFLEQAGTIEAAE